jgi:hypothetical protein
MRFFLLAALIVACLCPTLAFGQTQVNGATSGNWSSTASWNPAAVPDNGGGKTYDVSLLSSPAVTITLDIRPTIDTDLQHAVALRTNYPHPRRQWRGFTSAHIFRRVLRARAASELKKYSRPL